MHRERVLCNNSCSCWNNFFKKKEFVGRWNLNGQNPLLKKTLFSSPNPFFPAKQKFRSLMPKLHKYFIGIKLIFASYFPAALEPNKVQFYTSLPF